MCVVLPPENKHTVKLYEEALFTQGFLLSIFTKTPIERQIITYEVDALLF